MSEQSIVNFVTSSLSSRVLTILRLIATLDTVDDPKGMNKSTGPNILVEITANKSA